MRSSLAVLAVFGLLSFAVDAPLAQEATLKPHDPIKCDTATNLELSSIIIETKGIAVKVTGDCSIAIKDSFIVGDEAALKVTSGGSISVTNSTVISKRTAVSLTGIGAINLFKSVVYGKRYAVRMTNRGSVAAEGTTFYGRKKLHQLSSYAGDKKSVFKKWRAYKKARAKKKTTKK